ncbi:SMI1/KNR4 family protein [Pseudoalteromonas sp. SG44-1]|uniref:SMI1/KNR4 family protein n=1 Tax=unclassified Pseudoalteromonas TaxID=194690 RepID=UPI0015FFA93E|nr:MULTISPECIES: SMI1/KNR4 family protein [unclassified Pseudoalteromonas]MBB1420133.1 SMI1/KNR4 family protein [Pseudoalteromonas sp. SG44-1]MBB1436971.1 SMI1/KNR4 family protein [Pseudoalteromonas sp. SG43-6]MBB1482167.1 SMI1/KNR4 family protein [Pseudoalteromonas sp. SG41-2]
MIKLVKSYPAVTREQLEIVFSEVELQFPDSYIEFLLAQNGGGPEVESAYVCVNDPEYQILINCFYGVSKSDTRIDLLCAWGSHSHTIPETLCPIADDGIGNQICIGIQKPHFGNMYFWNKDGEVDYGEEVTFDNIEFLAGSFESFINCVRKM